MPQRKHQQGMQLTPSNGALMATPRNLLQVRILRVMLSEHKVTDSSRMHMELLHEHVAGPCETWCWFEAPWLVGHSISSQKRCRAANSKPLAPKQGQLALLNHKQRPEHDKCTSSSPR